MHRPPFRRALRAALASVWLVACSPDPEDELARVRALQEAGRADETLAPLRSLLAEQPSHPEANYRLGLTLLATGQLSGAVWPLRQASEDPEYAVDAGVALARVLVESRNFEEALRAADAVLAIAPDTPAAWALRAHSHTGLRDLEQALADVERWIAADPDDPAALLLRASTYVQLERRDEALAAYAEIEELARVRGDAASEAQACLARAVLQVPPQTPETPPEPEAVAPALAAFRDCAARFPDDPLAVKALADAQGLVGDRDAAERTWRAGVARQPEALAMHLGLANQLWMSGQHAEAEKVLQAATESLGAPEAWDTLAELYRRRGEPERAVAAVERALALGADSDLLRFKQADLLVDAGELGRAGALLDSFTEDSYREFIQGRIHLERKEYARALAAFERGLTRWPNNAGARALAGRAAQALGEHERALAEYREAVRADVRVSDAGLWAAELALALGRPGEAVEYVLRYLQSHPAPPPEAWVVASRSARAAGNAALAERSLAQLAAQPQGALPAALERAHQAMEARDYTSAVAALVDSGLDLETAANERGLRAWVEATLAAGDVEAARARLDRVLTTSPTSPSLLDARGRVFLRSGDREAAQRDFDAALAVDPGHAPALAGLGALAIQRGQLETALEYFSQAAALDPEDGDSAYRAAQMVLALGRREDAEERLRALLRRDPGHPGAANDLAWILAEDGRSLDEALLLARRAVRHQRSGDVLDTLGFVHLERGETDEAVATLTEASEASPLAPAPLYRLGLALAAQGDSAGAIAALERALLLGDFGEAEAARSSLARLKARPN